MHNIAIILFLSNKVPYFEYSVEQEKKKNNSYSV